jgi:hypothetical protein
MLSISVVISRNKERLLSVYRLCSLYFYFSGLSLRKAAAKMDWCLIVFYQKKLCFHLELIDSKIQTKKRCYQKENNRLSLSDRRNDAD